MEHQKLHFCSSRKAHLHCEHFHSHKGLHNSKMLCSSPALTFWSNLPWTQHPAAQPQPGMSCLSVVMTKSMHTEAKHT